MIFVNHFLEFCFLAKEDGTCDESQLQWYYDRSDGVCKQFIYRGCDGNQNRFANRQECESRCSQSQDVCILPRVVGPCSGSFRQWYYDAGTDGCYEFDYGGCQGNPNRFNNAEECQNRCQRVRPVTTSSTETPYVPYPRQPDREDDREREREENEREREQRERERERERDPTDGGICNLISCYYYYLSLIIIDFMVQISVDWKSNLGRAGQAFQPGIIISKIAVARPSVTADVTVTPIVSIQKNSVNASADPSVVKVNSSIYSFSLSLHF